MRTDLVLSPLGAHAPEMLEAATIADEGGFDGVWTYDHFSAAMLDKAWSHHPFTILGAIAAVTSRVRVGCLVANMVNRHPVQVASAMGTLGSLAPGRVVCGLGSGAGPASIFAGEQEMVHRKLDAAPRRRDELVEHIAAIRAVWSGDDLAGDRVSLTEPAGIVPPVDLPPIIIGASSTGTATLAAEHADGVNLRLSAVLPQHVEAVRAIVGYDTSFDISVNGDLDLDHPTGGDIEQFVDMGIHRRTLAIQAPYDLDAVRRIGLALKDAS